MAFSLNKVQLIGNLGQDAETSFTTNNLGITKFSIATTRNYKGKDGEWVPETTWHNIVAFNLSDFYKDALKKGKKVYIEGRISKRSYEKDGVKQYFTEVVSESIIPLDPRDSSGYSQGSSDKTNQEPIDTNTEDDLPF
jgi:single-strand DNA-binding protein